MNKVFSFAAACLATATVALKPREMAPEFENINAVVGDEFTKISLTDYKFQYVVMIFYPFDFTYVCPTELIAFSERVSDFNALNANILGISTDSHFTHLAWKNTDRDNGGLGEIDYPLLADISKDVARDFGVLVTDKEDGMYGAALRGLFIIDGTGKVRMMQINDDAVGRSVDETIRLIQGFQWADEHGEVCPSGWQPGDATIKPDQAGSKKYFKEKAEADAKKAAEEKKEEI